MFRSAWPFLIFLIPVVAILAGCTLAIVATVMRNRVRELEIRERIAMIEKGMVPPPEVDPRGFDHAVARQEHRVYGIRHRAPGRLRRVGVTLVGIGLGLSVLISFAGGSPRDGIGVGGFLVIVGLAFLINGLFESNDAPWIPPAPPSPTPSATNTSPSDPR